jgi:hypothetical protein
LVLQLIGVLGFCYNSASGADLIRTVYYPFLFLVDPLVRALFGGGDGTLRHLFLAALLVGAIAYSAAFELLAAYMGRASK